MKNSKAFKLNLNDFWKGLILAVLTAFLSVVYKTVEAGSLNFDWKFIGTTTLLAVLAYLTKNLTQDQNGKPFGSASL